MGVKMLSAIFEQFVPESPISVMSRGLMERVFAPERMDKIFENHAQVQYQQDLLFSSQIPSQDIKSELSMALVWGRQSID